MQYAESLSYVVSHRAVVDAPVETYDERFTTALAARSGGDGDEDARAAAHLHESYLEHAGRR